MPCTNINHFKIFKHIMKKIYLLFFAAGLVSLVACGPSAEEKAKLEAEAKAKMDSLFNVAGENMTADTTAAPADTTAKAE